MIEADIRRAALEVGFDDCGIAPCPAFGYRCAVYGRLGGAGFAWGDGLSGAQLREALRPA